MIPRHVVLERSQARWASTRFGLITDVSSGKLFTAAASHLVSHYCNPPPNTGLDLKETEVPDFCGLRSGFRVHHPSTSNSGMEHPSTAERVQRGEFAILDSEWYGDNWNHKSF